MGREEKRLPTSSLVSVSVTPEVPALVGGSVNLCSLTHWAMMEATEHPLVQPLLDPSASSREPALQRRPDLEGSFSKLLGSKIPHFSLLSSQPRVVTASCN